MKYLVLLFLVGFASSASIQVASPEHNNEITKDLVVASSLVNVLDLDDSQQSEPDGDGKPSEAGEKLRENFERLLQKIKEAVDQGKEITDDLLWQAKELNLQLKELKVGISDKGRELLEKIKGGAMICLQKLFEKFNEELEIIIDQDGVHITVVSLEKFKQGVRGMFTKLKDALTETAEKGSLTEVIENLFGKGTEVADQLLTLLKEKGEKGKNILLNFIQGFLGKNETGETRSVSGMWEELRGYFDRAKLDMKEKYLTFGEWAKDKMGKTLASLKTRSEKAKEIAKKLKENAETLRKEVLEEGLEFLRPYKQDLGELWDDLKKSVKHALEQEDKKMTKI